MLLPDVNVLLFAHRADAPDHPRYRAWLEGALASDEPLALCSPVITGLVRVATSPRVFSPPSTLAQAFAFLRDLMASPNTILLVPGRRHLNAFEQLCHSADARGDLVTDAYIAALAMEAGAQVVTADRDFARFEGLRRRHPLDG